MSDMPERILLPRAVLLPDVGLYLDQTVRWLNRSLSPLTLPEVTPSMVSNYVKKGYVCAPVRKQYDSEQLGRLLLLAIGKNVLPLESLSRLLIRWDESSQPFGERYDLYCADFEAVLSAVLEGRSLPAETGTDRLLHSLNVAAANIILLNLSLNAASREDCTASL